MKVSYPLSLKVSLWLILNLLLLAALGLGYASLQGGLGWSSLVVGPTGDRAQTLFNVIAGEVSAAEGEARNAVLERFGTAWEAEFHLIGWNETILAGGPVELPPSVKEKLDARGPGWFFALRPAGTGAPGPRRTPEAEGEPTRAGFEKGRFSSEGARWNDPANSRPSGAPATPDRRSGRFVVRTENPTGYWVAMRVAVLAPAGDRGTRPIPAMLLARTSSLWDLLHLLSLQTWFLAGGGVLALSVIFWLPLVRSITRPLAQLTSATGQIAEGRFDTRVDARRRDEIGRLGESVNRMAARLDAHMTGQKRFLGDVAHELCSPLARLQMATGILAEQAPPHLRDTVSDVREEVQQMSTLVNELLTFTKAGLQSREVVLGPVEIEPLVRSALIRENAESQVTLNLAPNLHARAEPDLLGRALANLVRNALRYAGTHGPITLSACRDDRTVVLAVEDDGPGVPAADLDRLGEPFFRPELARTRESGGVGLGLAIVRGSIAACQGIVHFSNRTPRGFRAEIRLPAA